MSAEQEKIQKTVSDIADLRAKINKRHFDNVNLLLRLDSAFQQIENSLGTTLSAPAAKHRFQPTPISVLSGTKVADETTSDGLVRSQEIKMFVENTKATYEGLTGRDADDILNGTDEEILRGVAKMAGMDDYAEAKLDAAYVGSIKEAILAKNKLSADQAAELAKLNDEANNDAGDGAVKEDAGEPKLTVAELTALKKEATEKYTELFGEAPDKSLKGAEIMELVEAKIAEGK